MIHTLYNLVMKSPLYYRGFLNIIVLVFQYPIRNLQHHLYIRAYGGWVLC